MKNKIYNFNVDKKEVKYSQFDRVRELFSTLEKIGKEARNTVIISFDGYDDVPEEIFEIPEIRRWVGKLYKKYPHILYFMNRELEGYNHILSCTFDVEAHLVGHLKTTFDEYLKLGYSEYNMPRQILDIRIPNDELIRMCDKILTYGIKVDDIDGATEIVDYLKNTFSK